ncbi:BspA family leucine-rich repeat surface protein [Dyadobacter pollutisoli]|uniref:BspA family leucine-rich repeat surface protein n=1 Tax=Dyadobacter pollutisoli TaxID=2910158 RepID=A0A9E8SQG7_9BACT|nr:BspA family leucine-rich repeat surface protein [Dyadobacter pollutisoli]WAC13022.1 BspA family leucine-rich repeat surface protein [Dyadobacter pollutisoli]
MKTLFYLIAFILFSSNAFAQNEFITRWNLATPGSGATQLYFLINSTGPVNYSWQEVSPGSASGSGTFPGVISIISGLPVGAIVDVRIGPTNVSNVILNIGGDAERLIDVRQWGTTAWTTMLTAFLGCTNLQISATDVPDLSLVNNMNRMFSKCKVLNGPANIGSWNTSNVFFMSSIFQEATAFNQPVGTWNTGNVVDMSGMFLQAPAFNQPVGNWNTANVTSMNAMFTDASAFNQPIGGWNTAKVTNMRAMFSNAPAFNQPIGTWNTAIVTDMSSMFLGASTFNQNISTWNTSQVTDMSFMFRDCPVFNQNISTWNTGKVTNMMAMFQNATVFNQPIGTWNMANATNVSNMMANALAFNQPLGTWNTANVTDMSSMMAGASAFNQSVDTWNTAKVTSMKSMFQNAAVFNQPLANWNTANVTDMNSMFLSAPVFNQPVGAWNTAKVTNMFSMFQGATKFNQPIGGWNVTAVTNMGSMFFSAQAFNNSIGSWTFNAGVNLGNMLNDSGLDCPNYSSSLIGWSNNLLTPGNLDLGAFQRPYGTNAVAARSNLISKGWSIFGDQASGTDCTALPVRLISFTGQRQGSTVLLTWKTAGEENNAGFEIEKSTDAQTFEKIGFVDGSGDAIGVRKYDFTDLNPLAENYYRLKQIDRAADRFDGRFEYSRILTVKGAISTLSIYPNPAQNELFVRNQGKNGQVSISNMEGRLLLKREIGPGKPIDLKNLPSGLFLVKIGTETKKLVIRK